MKHTRWLSLCAVATVGALSLAGCGGDDSKSGNDSDATRIKFVVNGNLGDKSFFDSAAEGLHELEATGDYDLDIVELGSDRTKWQPGFEDAAAGSDYDIFVAGTFDAVDFVSELAPQYPDQKFWFFDAAVDYEGVNGGCSNSCENVYSMTFKQNEGGYLAGIIAAGTVESGTLPGQESASKVGVLGAAEIPVIQDFVTGFQAGWADAGASSSDVLTQYIGGNQPFGDPARAKDIANSMYGQGAAIVWPVAGSSSFGVFESAVDNDAYAIGVDSDQSVTLTKPDEQATILTSILKNVGAALVETASADVAGTLPYGEASSLGLAENAVGFVDNAQYQELVPEDVRAKVDAAVQGIADGDIVVPSAF